MADGRYVFGGRDIDDKISLTGFCSRDYAILAIMDLVLRGKANDGISYFGVKVPTDLTERDVVSWVDGVLEDRKSRHACYSGKGDKPQKGGDPESAGSRLNVETFSYESARHETDIKDSLKLLSLVDLPAKDRIIALRRVAGTVFDYINALEAEVSE